MTSAEYDKLAGWFLAGTAEVNNSVTGWEKLHWLPTFENAQHWGICDYRERPQPTLPDEVWIPGGTTFLPASYRTKDEADALSIGDAKSVRYIRADGVIDGRKLQARLQRGSGVWYDCPGCEYRFRP